MPIIVMKYVINFFLMHTFRRPVSVQPRKQSKFIQNYISPGAYSTLKFTFLPPWTSPGANRREKTIDKPRGLSMGGLSMANFGTVFRKKHGQPKESFRHSVFHPYIEHPNLRILAISTSRNTYVPILLKGATLLFMYY